MLSVTQRTIESLFLSFLYLVSACQLARPTFDRRATSYSVCNMTDWSACHGGRHKRAARLTKLSLPSRLSKTYTTCSSRLHSNRLILTRCKMQEPCPQSVLA